MLIRPILSFPSKHCNAQASCEVIPSACIFQVLLRMGITASYIIRNYCISCNLMYLCTQQIDMLIKPHYFLFVHEYFCITHCKHTLEIRSVILKYIITDTTLSFTNGTFSIKLHVCVQSSAIHIYLNYFQFFSQLFISFSA